MSNQSPIASKLLFARHGKEEEEGEAKPEERKPKREKIGVKKTRGVGSSLFSLSTKEGAPFFHFGVFLSRSLRPPLLVKLPPHKSEHQSLLLFRKEVNRRTMPDIPAGKETTIHDGIRFRPSSLVALFLRAAPSKSKKENALRLPSSSGIPITSIARRHEAGRRTRLGRRKRASDRVEALSKRGCQTCQPSFFPPSSSCR